MRAGQREGGAERGRGRNLQQGPEARGSYAPRARAACRFRRARIRLTLLCVRGKFSPLLPAVNCLRQNVMRRSIVPLLLALALACGGGGGGTDRRTLVDSRDNYDPRSLDPALSTDVPTGRAVAYLFDGLTRFTPDAKVIPALATSWDVSPDGLTYTFHLRRGVHFTDGTPLAARPVL